MRKISEIQTDFDKALEEDRTDDGIRYALELNKAVKETESLVDSIAIERLQEIALAERAGTLVILPCKVGDTVYWPSCFESGIVSGPVQGILISPFGFDLKIAGVANMLITREYEKVFLTPEAAEEALEGGN